LARLFDPAESKIALIAFGFVSGSPPHVFERREFDLLDRASRAAANAIRAHLYGVFGTLALGMRVLDGEGVRLDRMSAHGGMFRTAGVAQRFLAAALDAPVDVAASAGEGGAWGVAVLAAFTASGGESLADYLTSPVFAVADTTTVSPGIDDVAGFAAYLDRYQAGLAVERAAVTAL
jgi:sugar (pentulose or hexulose) kinase